MTHPPSVLVSLKNVSKSYDDKTVLAALDLDIYDGEFVTLLGPSGCGKTTILRLIAGFERPNHGQILLADEDITQQAAHLRHVNTVFQSYALFPHMSVLDNVAFGLRMEKVAEPEVKDRAMQALEMVQLANFAHRRPHQLSGGQQQRVAIARAAVKRPRLLLLDEPLSALDYKLRKQMQNELKRLQRQLGITFIFVTHDQEEALSMSDRVIVMREGHIEQIGTPRQVYENPKTLFVARFVGETNLFDAVIQTKNTSHWTLALAGQKVCIKARAHLAHLAEGQKVKVLLRPEDMRLYAPADRQALEDQPCLSGKVIERNYKGMTLDTVIALAEGGQILVSEFFDEEDPDFDYRLGESVLVSWVANWEVILVDEEAPQPMQVAPVEEV